MSDNTKIEWTDATAIVDRDGRRVRIYQRKDATRPGQQMRRRKLLEGLKWCRDCQVWLPVSLVGKNGLCRPHENEQARLLYRDSEAHRDERKRHTYRRSRNVEPMPKVAAELIAELFNGLCAYCGNHFETWDHVIPVSKGGTTTPGNMVPACRPCNSSKKNSDINDWLDRAPMIKPYTIEYLSFAGVL
ncbi:MULTISPECIES: HNH endonuclease [unclassified Paraburkholderia]|uniref:HNH endonuclease n=1 Tax=unclassified Paraburkholderia TaxID=2615204 RepID=UPI00179E08A1|nr:MULTISPECIES: HNH endonuclease [unclassified Paraburkholderia]MBB5443641.1 5-methylcytosine-specific restriction endonuclease McrA [Paraburkholderia sp. WSM4177]MBB5484138.1 5-methylcytosine-specific restriction endonuclease McrA [Paraburkholderia sp. WSM4180]